jgi:hypothetical protein
MAEIKTPMGSSISEDASNPMMTAPQAFKGISIQIGAEVESII